MIRPALIAAALLAAAPAVAEEPAAQRYNLELSVVQNGVQVVSTHTQILEHMPAEASASINGVAYHFTAELFPVEGDGEVTQLQLEARLTRGDRQVAAPRLTFLRGERAAVAVGDEAGDLLTLAITPIE